MFEIFAANRFCCTLSHNKVNRMLRKFIQWSDQRILIFTTVLPT